MAQCPFQQLALATPTLQQALKKSSQWASGCPFPNYEGKSATDSVLEVLASVPEDELSDLVSLLRSEGDVIRARLGIDDSGWEMMLGRIPKQSEPSEPSAAALAEPVAALAEATDDMDEARELAARKRRAEASRQAEATLLSVQLKHGTKEIHAAAENVQFVREFMQGRCSRAVYAAMLKDLYHVYVALEESVERCSRDDGPHASLDFSYELTRVPSLEADLRFLLGPHWRTARDSRPSVAAVAYAARLRELADTRPELLVAHTYTRYLGDLSGGRVLMRGAHRLRRPLASTHGTQPKRA